jgi:RNA-directed DNA polymerase
VKANSRTTDMHVSEKSDCAVLPVNRPNKGRQLPAEAGEERAQMKENIDQPHMLPTQSGEGMTQGLDGVRKAARERRQERFTALLHHLNIDLLRDSFYALKRKASPGVDGMRWAEYETGLEDRLSIFMAGFTEERTGHNPRGESISRSLMGGNDRWASRLWRTRSSNRLW